MVLLTATLGKSMAGRGVASPRFTFFGDNFIASLNGDGGGRRAGLCNTDGAADPVGDDASAMDLKSSFETNLSIGRAELGGGFTGDWLRALMGVLLLHNSSSELIELDLAT